MAKIVIDDKIPFIKGVFEKYAQVSYLPGGKITPQDVKDADALIVRTRTKCNKALLENSNVKHISTATIGYDHINVKEVEASFVLGRKDDVINCGGIKISPEETAKIFVNIIN